MKITQHAFIYTRKKYSGEWEYFTVRERCPDDLGYVFVGEQDITFDIPDDFDPSARQSETIKAQIAAIQYLDAEAIANARLISAAPDLLAALIAITNQLERVGDTRLHKDGQIIEDARAAIAKAEQS